MGPGLGSWVPVGFGFRVPGRVGVVGVVVGRRITTGQPVEGPTFEIPTVPWLSNHTFVYLRLCMVPRLQLL